MEKRRRMKELCGAIGSYPIAAKLIAAEAQRRLSVDTIKSWTCNAETSRARTCPDWAIAILEKKVQSLDAGKNT